jgi:hypothetical protein
MDDLWLINKVCSKSAFHTMRLKNEFGDCELKIVVLLIFSSLPIVYQHDLAKNTI